MYLQTIKVSMGLDEAENLTQWMEALISNSNFESYNYQSVLLAEHFTFILDKLVSQMARSRKKGKSTINLSLKGVYWQSVLNTFQGPNPGMFPVLFGEVYGRYFVIYN